ncbi:MAG TPA: MFS transporter [Longimicrobiales bacterium]|nr:MFS transporter [Longimicrobiales bacterium]
MADGNGYRYSLPAGEAGSAGGQTLIAALLPVLLAPHAPSTFWIGAVIAMEGLFALTVPYLSGAVSDALPVRFARWFGRRGALLLCAVPFMAIAIMALPFRDSFWAMAALAMVYFLALHSYSTPLRAMLIDATPRQDWGTVQGVMGAVHLGGVAFGLVAGGLLYSAWEPLPFLVGGGLLAGTTALTLFAARRLRLGDDEDHQGRTRHWRPRAELAFWRDLLGRRRARRFLLANILWNGGTEGIRPYLFLFATTVLGIAVHTASLAMIAFLGAAIVGSVIVGRVGDRFGRTRILIIGTLITGCAMVPGILVRDLAWLLILLVPAGVGAAALVSLPYPVFASLIDEDDIGRSTGAFYMSVGVARLLAPLAVGAAIDLARPLMPGTAGYPVMWPVAGALVLAGAAVLRISGVGQENGAAH